MVLSTDLGDGDIGQSLLLLQHSACLVEDLSRITRMQLALLPEVLQHLLDKAKGDLVALCAFSDCIVNKVRSH